MARSSGQAGTWTAPNAKKAPAAPVTGNRRSFFLAASDNARTGIMPELAAPRCTLVDNRRTTGEHIECSGFVCDAGFTLEEGMNAINRLGQKVVCIAEIDVVTQSGARYPGPVPVLDEVYTVTGFGPTGMKAPPDLPDADIGIILAEIPTIRGRSSCDRTWRNLTWPLVIFRPVDERKTDISDLVRVAKETSQPKRQLVPTHVSVDAEGRYSLGGYWKE